MPCAKAGLAAITVPLMAFLSAGQHVLFPDSFYGAGREFAEHVLPRMGRTSGAEPGVRQGADQARTHV